MDDLGDFPKKILIYNLFYKRRFTELLLLSLHIIILNAIKLMSDSQYSKPSLNSIDIL